MSDALDIAYILGVWSPAILAVVAVMTIVVNIIKQKKRAKNPRTEKMIKKELRELLNSEDGKVRGLLLAWCILTSFIIALIIIFGGNELSNWLQAIFLLVLLIMAIKGRGSRLCVSIILGILAVILFWGCANTTGAKLQLECYMSHSVEKSLCRSIPDYAWENEARLLKISGATMGAYYGVTALYFCFSKKVKRHFIWGERQAELWRELETRDKVDESKIYTDDAMEPDNDDDEESNNNDIGEQLKELKKQNRRLANKIAKLENNNRVAKEKSSRVNNDGDGTRNTNDNNYYDDDL